MTIRILSNLWIYWDLKTFSSVLDIHTQQKADIELCCVHQQTLFKATVNVFLDHKVDTRRMNNSHTPALNACNSVLVFCTWFKLYFCTLDDISDYRRFLLQNVVDWKVRGKDLCKIFLQKFMWPDTTQPFLFWTRLDKQYNVL